MHDAAKRRRLVASLASTLTYSRTLGSQDTWSEPSFGDDHHDEYDDDDDHLGGFLMEDEGAGEEEELVHDEVIVIDE